MTRTTRGAFARAYATVRRSGRRVATAGAALAVAGASLVAVAPSAVAAVSPVQDRPSGGVTADALPTVQVDGVVWSQAVVGNTVYAGGKFGYARPAGAAAGTNQTARNNLLAYNITNGTLITSFAPSLNAQAKVVAASPDGTRVYVGGSFTTANGQPRYRLAAYDTSTGALISSFAPTLDATVNALAVTNTTVYAGGVFGSANGVARNHLAAFSAGTGATLGWAPSTDDVVDAMVLTPDGTHVVVGGAFQHLNSTTALGLGSVDATTGATVPFAVNQVVKDYGSGGAILSLRTDGSAIYGAGYTYGDPSNFEGVFSANPSTGAINWLADCHGDSYDTYPAASQVYVVSHEHYCANIGGFAESNPQAWQRSTAFSKNATGTVLTNGESGPGYGNFSGRPSPSLINWFPDLEAGTVTGQDQAAWTVEGNGNYVVEGGEFPTVNGAPQAGLVRFAVPSLAPNKRGPQDTTTATTPSVSVRSATTTAVSWKTNWDQDNDTLTYRLYRNNAVIRTVSAVSQFWNRPTLSWTDTGLTHGTRYSYYVTATDPSGNVVRTASVAVTP